MSKYEMNLWGRDFSLDIIYDCYPGESVLDIQREAFKKFCSATQTIISARKNVDQYILSNHAEEIGAPEIDNIFKYVMPKSIYIPRRKKERVVAIMCNYKFDMEHGLAIIFENEELKEIGAQDIIL